MAKWQRYTLNTLMFPLWALTKKQNETILGCFNNASILKINIAVVYWILVALSYKVFI